MGTNYYLVYNETIDDTCPCCGHGIVKKKELHLGKSIHGWTFALHVYPEQGIHTWADVLYEILQVTGKGGWIKDEYGTEVEIEMFVDIVTERSSCYTLEHSIATAYNTRYKDVDDYLKRNNAVAGPNNLLRQKIDRYCIGHGDGTYDYCVGEFS
jgi:hypothetical protein